MTFADEIEKVASERFSLVRLEPARQINNIWSSIGGGVFEYEFTETVSRILEEGTSLTKTTGIPTVSGTWSQDGDDFTVYVYPTDSSAVSIMYYYLFYTSDYDRIYPVDVTAGSDICWNGRITQDPSVGQSINNVANSFTLTSTTSAISLANADNEFQKFLTDEDSFANKNARAWVVVNDEIDDIFTGKIVSLNIGIDSIGVNLNDGLNISLNEPAYYGEPVDEAIITLDSYSDSPISSINKPIPLIFGETNQHRISALRGANTILNSFLLTDSSYEAINVDKEFNLEWVVCRIPDENDIYSYTFGGTSFPESINFDIIETSAGSRLGIVCDFDGFAQDSTDVEIGDTFTYTTASGTYNAVVINVTPGGTVEFISDNRTDTSPMSVTAVSTTTKNPLVRVEDSGQGYILIPGDQYTTTITSQTNTKLITIDIEANIGRALSVEAIRLRGVTPTPIIQDVRLQMGSNSRVKWRIRTDNVLKNHSDVLKNIVENAGYTTDATSFAASKASFDANVAFSIPFIGENKINKLNTYIQRILSSTIAAIYIDSDGIVHYDLLSAPSAGDEISDDDYFMGSLQTKLSYRDIATKVSWNNVHSYDSAEGFNLGTSKDYPINMTLLDPNITSENDDAQFLHETTSTDFIDHVITDITLDSRYLKLLDMRSERFVNYKYTTAAQSLLKDILDDITISDPRVLGGSGSVNTKITAFTKDDDKVTITVSDLLGL